MARYRRRRNPSPLHLLWVAAVLLAWAWSTHPAYVIVGAGLLFVAAGLWLIRKAQQRKRQAVADRLLSTADATGRDGRGFEALVGRLYDRDGCTRVRAGGGAGDLGADVMCTSTDGWLVVTQCKRYGLGHKVGSPDMQRFLGTVRSVHRADVAVFVTTSQFTAAARSLGESQGVLLVDRYALGEWMAGRWTPVGTQIEEGAA